MKLGKKSRYRARSARASIICVSEKLENRQLLSTALVVHPTAAKSALLSALLSANTGIVITSSQISYQHTKKGALSVGTYTNPGNVFGIGNGIIMSNGDVSQYGSPAPTNPNTNTNYNVAATVDQEALLRPISGNQIKHFDVTELDITFNMPAKLGQVFFNVVFGSREYPQYVGSQFVDAFGLYVNGQNIANVDGKPVNIDHPAFVASTVTALPGLLAPGGNPLLQFSAFVGTGSKNNHLTFIIADTSDSALDTTAYISALGALPPNPNIPTAAVAAPAMKLPQAKETFTVTYTGLKPISVASIDSSDILVTGPNGYSQLAQLVSIDTNSDGSPRTATYSVTGPGGGGFTVADDGLYTLSMQFHQVSDNIGDYVTEGSLGSFAVQITGATLNAPTTYQAGTNSYTFQVNYIDPAIIKLPSIDSADILVTGPGGYSKLATLVGSNVNGDGTGSTAAAVYSIPGAGGNWALSDAGAYTFTLQNNQVTDLAGGSITGGALATVSLSAYGGLVSPPVGEFSGAASAGAVAVDAGGKRYFAWYDAVSQNLKFATRSAAGVFSAVQIIDPASGAGAELSMALNGTTPSVAYYDAAGKKLKYAHLSGSRWVLSTVDQGGDVGQFPSLTFDSSHAAAISYYDATNGDLKLARQSGSTFLAAAIDTAGNVGLHSSIALNPLTQQLAIAYEDTTNGKLKFFSVSAGATGTSSTIPNTAATARRVSLAFNAQGNAFVGFFNPTASPKPEVDVAELSTATWSTVERFALSSNAALATGIQLLMPTTGLLPQVVFTDNGSNKLVVGQHVGGVDVLSTIFSNAEYFDAAAIGPGNQITVLTEPVGTLDLLALIYAPV